jgi:putative transposase
MSNTAFYQLYYHFVWSTKRREAQIKDTLIQFVDHVVTEDAKRRGAGVIACGSMPEHVHLLVSLRPTVAPANFIGQVKGGTAYELNRTLDAKVIQWQVGYGVLSMREKDLAKVIEYVNSQPKVHASRKKPSILELTPDE